MGCDYSLHKHYLFCVSNTGVVIYCALPAMFIHQYVMAAINNENPNKKFDDWDVSLFQCLDYR
jgi:hypothetical protein